MKFAEIHTDFDDVPTDDEGHPVVHGNEIITPELQLYRARPGDN